MLGLLAARTSQRLHRSRRREETHRRRPAIANQHCGLLVNRNVSQQQAYHVTDLVYIYSGYFSRGKIFVVFVVFVVEKRTTKQYRIVPGCGLEYHDHENFPHPPQRVRICAYASIVVIATPQTPITPDWNKD